MKRVELSVPESDAQLLRRVAKALIRDDAAAEELRTVIDEAVPEKNRVTFKEWLESE